MTRATYTRLKFKAKALCPVCDAAVYLNVVTVPNTELGQAWQDPGERMLQWVCVKGHPLNDDLEEFPPGA